VSTLLLIDDEEGIRKVLSLSLRKDGYQVLAAENGEKGLGAFRQNLPPIVLTDIKMPGIDGIEVLKRVKEIAPDTEVIVITGHGDMEVAIRSLQLGASDFITKPVSDDALSIALKRAEQKLEMKRRLKEYTHDLESMVKAATEELRRRYEFEDKLIQASIDGIVATNEKGSVVIFNEGASRIFGYSRLEAIRRMAIDALYPTEIAREIKEGLYGKKYGEEHIFRWKEINVKAKDGQEMPVRFSGAILYEKEEVVGSVGFLQDLREIKRLEQELIESERLAAIGQTVAGLAHCVKNILYGLKGGVYVVNTAFKSNNPEQLKTGWDMVNRNIGKVSDLVMDLLNYSKEREPDYQRCFLNTIAGEVCALMELAAQEVGVKIIRNFDQAIGEVALDPKGIHRCVLNLVSNAIDACHFDLDRKKDCVVEVKTALEDKDTVVIEVSDNGCGMDEEVKNKIFTSFFSTKSGAGTGLGLLVTQKIIKEHGGTITVESEPGKGSTFAIRLPLRENV